MNLLKLLSAALPKAHEPSTDQPLGAESPIAFSGSPPTRKTFLLSPWWVLQIAVTVGLISFLFSRIGWQPVVEVFSGVIWLWVIASILLTPFAILLVTVRWKILLRAQGLSLPAVLLFKRLWVTRFVNNFSPGQIGGDLFRVFGPWEIPLNRTAVGTSVAYDRYTGLIGLLVAIALVGLVEYNLAKELGLELIPIFAVFGAALLLLAVVTHRPFLWARWLVARCPVKKARSVAEGVLRSMLLYVDRRGTTLNAIAISVAFRLVIAIGSYFEFLALGVDISFETVVFISLLVNVISLVPISINGWGLREGAFVLLYTQVGVGSAEALSVALLGRVLGAVMSSGGALFYLTTAQRGSIRRWFTSKLFPLR